MSNITDRGVIDAAFVEDERFILVIVDYIEWSFPTRRQHASMLQDKINDYLDFIVSGQAEQTKPGFRPVIRIVSEHSYSRYCLDFLKRVKALIGEKNICDIEWTHISNECQFNDGFSDDLVFDINKVYPRLKKNWAKNPLEEVSLTAFNEETCDYSGRCDHIGKLVMLRTMDSSERLVMLRTMDSYIGLFVQDTENTYTYLTYDMLPEDQSIEELEEVAFENLVKNVNYQMIESKEPGIYGIIAGGDFEAESILLNDIWNTVSKELDDDIIITIPTKDIVFFTNASNNQLRKKMLDMAHEMFTESLKDTPYMIFSKDVFLYMRREGKIVISKNIRF